MLELTDSSSARGTCKSRAAWRRRRGETPYAFAGSCRGPWSPRRCLEVFPPICVFFWPKVRPNTSLTSTRKLLVPWRVEFSSGPSQAECGLLCESGPRQGSSVEAVGRYVSLSKSGLGSIVGPVPAPSSGSRITLQSSPGFSRWTSLWLPPKRFSVGHSPGRKTSHRLRVEWQVCLATLGLMGATFTAFAPLGFQELRGDGRGGGWSEGPGDWRVFLGNAGYGSK